MSRAWHLMRRPQGLPTLENFALKATRMVERGKTTEVIVSGQMRAGTFVGERDSLVTKCPSKFTTQKSSS